MAHSGAARATVEALTKELAARWAGDGVSVVAIALGRLATESLRKYPAELWRRAAESVPLMDRLTAEPTANRSTLRLEVSASLAPVLLPLLARVRRLFDLSADPHLIAAHLGPLAAAHPGRVFHLF